ncbi:aldehyde dehydrogenase [Nocardia alni]|uniref:aldehyde dehydrogenase n=1 Tax=Nocardia alni TaxID=2815723 RepID=UPI001C248572|nr:aldehyde dehydrogenase [Nocardia alni]
MYRSDALFVGGAWIPPATSATIDVVSPHTEKVVGQVPAAAPADVDAAVRSARAAFDEGPWPRLEPAHRIEAVRLLAQHYADSRTEMAALITEEMGAPTSFAQRAHVGLPSVMIDAYCQLAESHAWQQYRPGRYGHDIDIRREPVGVVAAIVPWNMPQFLSITKLIPALLAGCCVILKAAPETPLDALLLADIIDRAGLPEGVVSVLPGDAVTGAYLAQHPGVDKVSFTGSTAAGKSVAAACAVNLTRVDLELGGKSAAIALDDADPEAFATGIVSASLSNSGQICNALTRLVLPSTRADEFVEALAERMRALRIGDPNDPDTRVGPLVSQRQQHRVLEYLDLGIAEGARAVVGGSGAPAGLEQGWYVRPTLFTRADNQMRIAREEIFGPVLTALTYDTEDQAIAIANDSDYGLAAAVWSGDRDHATAVAGRIRAGTVGINQGYDMDPFAPFGGMKASGYGRELGPEGLNSYTEVKSISALPSA